jgi:hypothetical protein
MKTFQITIVDSVNGSKTYLISTFYGVTDAIKIARDSITPLGGIISISTTAL